MIGCNSTLTALIALVKTAKYLTPGCFSSVWVDSARLARAHRVLKAEVRDHRALEFQEQGIKILLGSVGKETKVPPFDMEELLNFPSLFPLRGWLPSWW